MRVSLYTKKKKKEKKRNVTHILSQSYNATVFYYQLSTLPHNDFNNLFPTVQETNHLMEVGWLKKNELNGDVPVSHMHFVQRKRCVDF